MNKFEMPKMNIAKFCVEDIITTSTGEAIDPNLAAAKEAATGELATQQVSVDNIFYFEMPTE